MSQQDGMSDIKHDTKCENMNIDSSQGESLVPMLVEEEKKKTGISDNSHAKVESKPASKPGAENTKISPELTGVQLGNRIKETGKVSKPLDGETVSPPIAEIKKEGEKQKPQDGTVVTPSLSALIPLAEPNGVQQNKNKHNEASGEGSTKFVNGGVKNYEEEEKGQDFPALKNTNSVPSQPISAQHPTDEHAHKSANPTGGSAGECKKHAKNNYWMPYSKRVEAEVMASGEVNGVRLKVIMQDIVSENTDAIGNSFAFSIEKRTTKRLSHK